jgi:hypothetical protein
VVEKEMSGGVAFMVRGHMAVGVIKSRMMVRVSPEEGNALLKQPHVGPMDFSGRTMPGFLYVEPAGLATAAALKKWIDRAVAYAEERPEKVKKTKTARKPRVNGRA